MSAEMAPGAGRRELLKGTLDMLILQTLTVQPMHGYGIAQHIERLSEDVLSVEQGSLYPALERLHKRGWVKSKWGESPTGRQARYYTITAAGRQQLGEELDDFDQRAGGHEPRAAARLIAATCPCPPLTLSCTACACCFAAVHYDREIADEQAFHLALEAMQQEHASHGALTPEAARYAARRRYGNLTISRGRGARHGGTWILRDGARRTCALRCAQFPPHARVHAVVVIATLAIGIGANTAIFSAMNALLLRPLPFSEPERLMKVSISRPAAGDYPANDNAPWSYPKFVVLRETQKAYSSIGLHGTQDVTVRFGDDAERLREEVSDAGYFEALRVAPQLGRSFSPAEDAVANGPAVAILSHAFWTRRYGADPSAIGRSIDIGGKTHQIIGVMPEGFRGLSGQAELWRPAVLADPTAAEQAFSHQYSVVARLNDEATVAQAQLEAARVADVIHQTYPDAEFNNRRDGVIARELDATRIDPLVRRSLYVLFGAVTLVLLIACANVANCSWCAHPRGRTNSPCAWPSALRDAGSSGSSSPRACCSPSWADWPACSWRMRQ